MGSAHTMIGGGGGGGSNSNNGRPGGSVVVKEQTELLEVCTKLSRTNSTRFSRCHPTDVPTLLEVVGGAGGSGSWSGPPGDVPGGDGGPGKDYIQW